MTIFEGPRWRVEFLSETRVAISQNRQKEVIHEDAGYFLSCLEEARQRGHGRQLSDSWAAILDLIPPEVQASLTERYLQRVDPVYLQGERRRWAAQFLQGITPSETTDQRGRLAALKHQWVQDTMKALKRPERTTWEERWA